MATQSSFETGSLNGIASKKVTFPVPEEGELFRLRGQQIAARIGNQVRVLDPQSLVSAQGTSGKTQLSVDQLLQQQGIDVNKLQNINLVKPDAAKAGLELVELSDIRSRGGQGLTMDDIQGIASKIGTFAQAQGISKEQVGEGFANFQDRDAAMAAGEFQMPQPEVQSQGFQAQGFQGQQQQNAIPFQQGLNQAEQQSIQNLVQNKPVDQWNENDINNFAFATGIPFTGELSLKDKQSIANLVANKPVGQWNDIDKQNWAFATGGAALPSGTSGASSGQDLRGIVEGTEGGLIANKDFVNGAIKAFLGRDANADELANLTGKTVDQVREAILSGASEEKINEVVTNLMSPENFSVDITDEVDSDILQGSATNSDIQVLIDQQNQLRDQLITLLKPSEQEIDLKTEVRGIRERANQIMASFEEGLIDIQGQTIPMKFITGQAQALERRANAKLNQVQRAEALLLEELGLEQELRKANADAVQTGLSFIQDDIQLQFQIEDRIQRNQDRLIEQQRQLTQDARDQLSIMMESMSGLSLDDIPPQEQMNLLNLASKAGISPSLLSNALKNSKEVSLYDSLKRDLEIQDLQNRVAQSGAAAATPDLVEIGGQYFTYNEETNQFEPITVENLPPVQSQISSAMGDGVVTAYGSPLWEHGLDVQFEGMEDAEISIPFAFEVIKAGQDGGFGNQVRVKRVGDGQEFWFSHLSQINLAPGSYLAGTVIGNQGATGSTLGKTGVHVDITAPDGKGGFLTPKQVAQQIGLTAKSTGSTSSARRDAESIMSGTLSMSKVSTKNNHAAEVAAELAKLKSEALASGDIVGVIRSSGGGKSVDSTFINSLEKAFNTVGQLEVLADSVDAEATGPIWGIIRSNNPYDTKAQDIKSQINAIVPNLARGIYGEVGVLTDNDIRTYSKTLPNLTSTEEVRNAVLGITLRSVQRSIENKITLSANLGRDVSGIENQYLEVKKTADKLLGSVRPELIEDPLNLDSAGIQNDPLGIF